MGKQQRAIPHGRYRLLDDKRTVRAEKLCAIYPIAKIGTYYEIKQKI